ncbi:MAG: sensor histidine kinase [Thermoanaerobaculia bacterium]
MVPLRGWAPHVPEVRDGGHDFRQGSPAQARAYTARMQNRSSVLVRATGLAACAVACLPVGENAAREPALLAAGFVVFAAGFWLLSGHGCDRLPRSVRLGLLAACSLTALFMTARLNNGFSGVLLVLVAAVVLGVLPMRAALVWLALQTLGFAWVLLSAFGLLPAAMVTVSYAGFQAFALYTSHVARSEIRAREELARVNAELLATRRLLVDSSRAEERVRIARELHDVLGHHLTALSLHLEAARHAPPGMMDDPLGTAQELTKRTLHEVRRVVTRLREEPAVDLAGALVTLTAGIVTPRVHLSLPDGLRLEDPERAHALVRCAQEVLTNAMKHAAARNVWLELFQGPEGVELRARDDGRGTGLLRHGHGLSGMRERLERLGGRLAVESSPGKGFQVTAWLPLLGGAAP